MALPPIARNLMKDFDKAENMEGWDSTDMISKRNLAFREFIEKMPVAGGKCRIELQSTYYASDIKWIHLDGVLFLCAQFPGNGKPFWWQSFPGVVLQVTGMNQFHKIKMTSIMDVEDFVVDDAAASRGHVLIYSIVVNPFGETVDRHYHLGPDHTFSVVNK